MIAGSVDDGLEATVMLTVRGPSGRSIVAPFVIDTGYSGGLLLPPSMIQRLLLDWLRTDFATLADGSTIEHQVFRGILQWDGADRLEAIDQADTAPLLGTRLLRGYELTARMRPHGKVTLKKLPPKKRKTRT